MMKEKSLPRNTTIKFILFFVIILIGWWLGKAVTLDIEEIRATLFQFPLWLSGFIFVIGYVVSTTFLWFGPKDVLRISAALFYGSSMSTFLVSTAELLNAPVMFFLSRKLGREYIQTKFKLKDEYFDQARKKSSPLGIFALRINLLVPLRFIDLGYGVTQINFAKYLMASILPTLIRILIQQYVIASVGELLLKGDIYYAITLLSKNTLFMICAMIYTATLIMTTIVAIIQKIRRFKKRN